MSAITTHVLDTARGLPARNLAVVLERAAHRGWQLVGRGTTDAEGRLGMLPPADVALTAGRYRLTFDTAAYFRASGQTGFYPEVSIVFVVDGDDEHYHVPLLLSPYGYSTYRGS